MRRQIRHHLQELNFIDNELKWVTSIENYKRRRALPFPSVRLIERDLMYFDRLLHVRKLKELIFITKAEAKLR